MKKILFVILAFIMLSVCVFAETEGETFTLYEYLMSDDGAEGIDHVIMYPGIGFYTGVDLRRELDLKEFISLAENIILTDTAGAMFLDENGNPESSVEVYCIEIFHGSDRRYTPLMISVDGKVDKYSFKMSRLPEADYEMSQEDFLKLEEMYNSGSSEKKQEMIQDMVDELLDERRASSEIKDSGVNDTESGDKYNLYALIIVVIVMAAAVAVTMILTKKKKQ